MLRAAYYNEIDPYAAQWLRNLINAGHIAAGDVDERSIVDVQASDIVGYVQCHFFAGIGGWSAALRLARWSDDLSVWTGSCPCQPFSTSGKKAGATDRRHLWPAFGKLIADCRPAIVFGEQVARAAGHKWLSGVRSDLETHSYAVGAANLCAACVGKWHRRQRLYWVAIADYQIRRPFNGCVAHCEGAGEGTALPRTLWQGNRSAGNGGPATETSTVAWLRRWESEHGLRCIDDGLPGDVAIHRALGNAIVPQIAAAFIEAALECRP